MLITPCRSASHDNRRCPSEGPRECLPVAQAVLGRAGPAGVWRWWCSVGRTKSTWRASPIGSSPWRFTTPKEHCRARSADQRPERTAYAVALL